MPYSPAELSDLQDIRDLTLDYANAIDQQEFDTLDNIFTADAYIDYTAMGGPEGRYPEIKPFLKASLPLFPNYQHFNSNCRVHLHGDNATARIYCLNPMQVPTSLGGNDEVMLLGLWYVDKYIRQDNHWRICERVEEASSSYNKPDSMPG